MNRLTKRPILLTILCVALLAVVGKIRNNLSGGPGSEDVRLLRELRKEYVAQMWDKENLRCTGFGTGGMDEIENISFFFRCPKTFRQDEIGKARKVALSCSETLLNLVNSNKALRPYLAQYPFTNENIDIYLIFQSEREGPLSTRSLSGITVCKTGLLFNIKGKGKYGLVRIKKESYQDALRLACSD